ncbi:hypothetical protein AAIB33_06440 [Microbacterium sp. AZCO]|uniref:hypothetical protein n=1 Tax=Microbacterium sp. AZCO TaxID=3142976 RepID=UPI0031F470D5
MSVDDELRAALASLPAATSGNPGSRAVRRAVMQLCPEAARVPRRHVAALCRDITTGGAPWEQ